MNRVHASSPQEIPFDPPTLQEALQACHIAIAITLRRFENSSVAESITFALAEGASGITFASANWKISYSWDHLTLRVTAELVEGRAENVNCSVTLTFSNWTIENYVLFPGSVYRGNRFICDHQEYPPILDQSQLGIDAPPRVTDIPRLGAGSIRLLTGALAMPLIGIHFPVSKFNFLAETETCANDRESSFEFSEEKSTARLHISSPGVRVKECYTMCNSLTSSKDRGADLISGDSLSIAIKLFCLPAKDIPALFETILLQRNSTVPAPQIKKQFPFQAAWELLEEKYQRDNWNSREGYYSVGLRENRHQDFQIGWVGGVINTYPLLQEGFPASKDRARQTIDFVFKNGGQSSSGFFHGCYHKGRWSGDGFDIREGIPHPDRNHYHLIRKSSDALFYLIKQFQLLSQLDSTWELPREWREGTMACADAFVRLWRRYGQFGQFIDIDTGDILLGGTCSGGIAPAALSLAARFLGIDEYSIVAKQAADYYLLNYTNAGLTNGGPGDALQCPDSESAAGLLESYLVIWEQTGEVHWLDAAEKAAAQLASWQMSYDYSFPKGTEFGRLDIRTAGSIFANSQNAHSAPGIATLSGNAYLRLFRATGKEIYLSLLQQLAHNITQYVSRSDRPIHCPDGRALPEGWVNERVNTSDWDFNLGGVFFGSTWAEIAVMLVIAEIPGIYAQKASHRIWVFDHVVATPKMRNGDLISLSIYNPTEFPAIVRVLVDDEVSLRKPLVEGYLLCAPRVSIPPRSSCDWALPR